MAKLSVKQENFCNYYLETGNASEAYRRSYSCDNMKDETVNERSCRLLKEYKISTRVRQLQEKLQEKSDITKEEAVTELSNIVRARVTDVLFAKGQTIKIKDISELPDHVVSCISVMKKVRGGIEVKLYDKISAIDRLSKLMGWDSPEKHEIKASVGEYNFEEWTDEELKDFIDEKMDNMNLGNQKKE